MSFSYTATTEVNSMLDVSKEAGKIKKLAAQRARKAARGRSEPPATVIQADELTLRGESQSLQGTVYTHYRQRMDSINADIRNDLAALAGKTMEALPEKFRDALNKVRRDFAPRFVAIKEEIDEAGRKLRVIEETFGAADAADQGSHALHLAVVITAVVLEALVVGALLGPAVPGGLLQAIFIAIAISGLAVSISFYGYVAARAIWDVEAHDMRAVAVIWGLLLSALIFVYHSSAGWLRVLLLRGDEDSAQAVMYTLQYGLPLEDAEAIALFLGGMLFSCLAANAGARNIDVKRKAQRSAMAGRVTRLNKKLKSRMKGRADKIDTTYKEYQSLLDRTHEESKQAVKDLAASIESAHVAVTAYRYTNTVVQATLEAATVEYHRLFSKYFNRDATRCFSADLANVDLDLALIDHASEILRAKNINEHFAALAQTHEDIGGDIRAVFESMQVQLSKVDDKIYALPHLAK